jgi:hypothetical protein
MSKCLPNDFYLAFRGPNPEKPLTWNDRMVALVTGTSSVTHVEPVLIFPCPASSSSPQHQHASSCHFCKKKKKTITTTKNKNKNKNQQNETDPLCHHHHHRHRQKKYHWVSYAVYRAPGRDRVFEWIDKPFNFMVYRFLHISCNEVQRTRVYSFLQAQVGKPFNYPGYRSWLFRFCCCLPRGCTHESLAEQTPAWICSEMSTVAMQRADLVPHLIPCNTSPFELVSAFLLGPAKKKRVQLMSDSKSHKLFS